MLLIFQRQAIMAALSHELSGLERQLRVPSLEISMYEISWSRLPCTKGSWELTNCWLA